MRLPIQEYVPKRQTHVLNIDTVMSIIINFLECGDWQISLSKAIPLRKQDSLAKKRRRDVDSDHSLDSSK